MRELKVLVRGWNLNREIGLTTIVTRDFSFKRGAYQGVRSQGKLLKTVSDSDRSAIR